MLWELHGNVPFLKVKDRLAASIADYFTIKGYKRVTGIDKCSSMLAIQDIDSSLAYSVKGTF